MSLRLISPPASEEYPAYANQYMEHVIGDGLILQRMLDQAEITRNFILQIPESRLTYRYAPGKWTIPEILVHIADDERIYAYRALRFARNDQTPLPGFEQDDFTKWSGAMERSIENILEEYLAVRMATLALFNGMSDVALLRSGVADGKKYTARALAYHLAGHELHHLRLIRERYLG